MAHEIDMSNDQENMAYVGETPWHGLGQRLTDDADIETWKIEAGMNWNIKSSAVEFLSTEGEEVSANKFPGRNVLYRSDTTAPLGIVGDDYKVVQPGQVLEFFRDLISDQGFKLETAGCLFGGRKFWALARIGENARIMGQDEISPYLLMATSCDGSMATSLDFTSVRVVCNNTLRMAIGGDYKAAKIKVPHSAIFEPDLVKHKLGVSGDTWDRFISDAESLANLKISRDDAIQIVANQLKSEWVDQDGNEMLSDDIMASSLAMRRIISLYDGEGLGSSFASANGTAWGLINAVTQYYDHEFGGKQEKSRAFERAHLTDRAAFKVKVASKLLEMAA